MSDQERCLQDEWDRHLINAWFKYKGSKMYATVFFFKEKYGESEERLERFPYNAWDNRVDVFAFVGQFMPKLQNWLLSTKETDLERIEKILKAMKALKLTQNNVRGLQKARHGCLKEMKRCHAAKVVSGLTKEQRVKTGGHDWRTVK